MSPDLKYEVREYALRYLFKYKNTLKSNLEHYGLIKQYIVNLLNLCSDEYSEIFFIMPKELYPHIPKWNVMDYISSEFILKINIFKENNKETQELLEQLLLTRLLLNK